MGIHLAMEQEGFTATVIVVRVGHLQDIRTQEPCETVLLREQPISYRQIPRPCAVLWHLGHRIPISAHQPHTPAV